MGVPKAEPMPRHKLWQIEGIAGSDGELFSPDGDVYRLPVGESFVRNEESVDGDGQPEGFIQKGDVRIPINEWILTAEKVESQSA